MLLWFLKKDDECHEIRSSFSHSYGIICLDQFCQNFRKLLPLVPREALWKKSLFLLLFVSPILMERAIHNNNIII